MISPRLLQVPGVADVVSYGGLVREVHVEPDVSKMVDLGVNLNDVFLALKKASANATGGLRRTRLGDVRHPQPSASSAASMICSM